MTNMPDTPWYLYVLRCGDGSLYTGATNDVSRRLAQHQAGQGARYTRAHRPVALAAAWRFPDQSTALRAEAAFKRLNRPAKDAWIAGRWPFADAPFAFAHFDAPGPHHFCPRCGGQLALQPHEGAQLPVCSVCGRQHFSNAKPCGGMLVVREGAVLLVRRRFAPYRGYWDIPGGFLGPDELPEAGTIREAREETGLEVRVVDFLGFYMDVYEYQDETHSILNIYFVGEAEGEPHAGDDADACRWFPLDALPEQIAFEHEPLALADLAQWISEKSDFYGHISSNQ